MSTDRANAVGDGERANADLPRCFAGDDASAGLGACGPRLAPHFWLPGAAIAKKFGYRRFAWLFLFPTTSIHIFIFYQTRMAIYSQDYYMVTKR